MSTGVSNAINTARQLEQRVACNQAAPGSFRRFVQRLLAVRGDDCVLDLGAGLGEQLIPAAEKARRAVGLDVSAEMVEALRRRLPRGDAEVVLGDMDDLDDLPLRGPFTLAYSVYSIYYSRDPARLVRSLAPLLSGRRARLVVVAPDLGNNAAWYADLQRLYPLPAPVLASTGVCRNLVLPALLDGFESVHCAGFQSEVGYPSLDELMRYYDACAPYCRPDARDQARAFFARKFEQDGAYRISKRALGLVARRPRKAASREARSDKRRA